MVLAEHWVARTRRGWAGVVEPASAQWLWSRLRERYSLALACTLMPDHVHLLADGAHDPDTLRRILQHHSRRFGARWDLLDPQPVHTRRILGRTVRYIVLNAPRDRLVADPFEWPWSTLRDLVGAVVDPWTPIGRLVAATRTRPDALVRELVEPDCALPTAASGPMVIPVEAIAEAVAAACRTTPAHITRPGATRRMFVALGTELSGCRIKDLAAACGITVGAVYKLRGTVAPAAVAAARRCLVDARLRQWHAPATRRSVAGSSTKPAFG